MVNFRYDIMIKISLIIINEYIVKMYLYHMRFYSIYIERKIFLLSKLKNILQSVFFRVNLESMEPFVVWQDVFIFYPVWKINLIHIFSALCRRRLSIIWLLYQWELYTKLSTVRKIKDVIKMSHRDWRESGKKYL